MNIVKYTIPYLKDECLKNHLSTNGKKSELQNRLFQHYQSLRKPPEIVYTTDQYDYSQRDEIYLGTRYNMIYGNGLVRYEKNNSNYDMYLDRNLLKKYILENKKIPRTIIEAIINVYTAKRRKNQTDPVFPGYSVPNLVINPMQHPCFKTRLYQHQKVAIQWMKALEEQIETDKVTHKQTLFDDRYQIFTEFDPILLFDVQEEKIIIGMKRPETYHIMKTLGGILGDDVGLGKTLTLLGLLVEHKKQTILHQKINPIQYGLYPNTSCNLVICPGYLVDQWSIEIFKHISPPLHHYIINGKKHHEELTYKDLLTADVIIVSDKFLRSHYYCSLVATFTDLQLNSPDPLCEKAPILAFIEWSRIIIDEYPLIFSNPQTVPLINKLTAKFKWLVSATPDLHNVAVFLGWNPSYDLQAYLQTFYLARNKDQCDEVFVSDYEESIDYIPMTATERQIYDHSPRSLLRPLCSSILISGDYQTQGHKTVLEFYEYLMLENTKKIQNFQQQKIHNQQKLLYYQTLLEREQQVMPEELKDQALVNIQTLRLSNTSLENNQKTIEQRVTYQKNILTQIKKEDHTCLICFEKINSDHIIITSCCHIYCPTCIQKIQECSVCRTEFTITYLTIQDPPNEHISKYGSKIAKLIMYLQKYQEQPGFKAIVYTQWNKMLPILLDSLEKENLSAVLCNNNMKQIKNTLEVFQHKTNIMVMSLQTHSSGLDLHNVTHIFFMDVLSGSNEDNAKKEKQAIGRAYRIGQVHKIHVIRLIMENTVEHELFQRNHGLVFREPCKN